MLRNTVARLGRQRVASILRSSPAAPARAFSPSVDSSTSSLDGNLEPHSGKLLCLDLEGVLIPECWLALAELTGVDELLTTTAHEPDYDKLMRMRLDIMAREGIGMKELQVAIEPLKPLPGAVEFMEWASQRYQIIILSDTFYEFGMHFMRQLGYPTLFCHKLDVDPSTGIIQDYKLRQPDPKRKCIEAFRSLNFATIAAGDSYNDRTMLGAAHKGIWYDCTPEIAEELPMFPVARGYQQLQATILEMERQINAEAAITGLPVHQGGAAIHAPNIISDPASMPPGVGSLGKGVRH